MSKINRNLLNVLCNICHLDLSINEPNLHLKEYHVKTCMQQYCTTTMFLLCYVKYDIHPKGSGTYISLSGTPEHLSFEVRVTRPRITCYPFLVFYTIINFLNIIKPQFCLYIFKNISFTIRI